MRAVNAVRGRRGSAAGGPDKEPLPAYALVRGCPCRWWQVLGSNQRTLSRRFYSTLLLAEFHTADQRGRGWRLVLGPLPSAMCPCARDRGRRDARTAPAEGYDLAFQAADRRFLHLTARDVVTLTYKQTGCHGLRLRVPRPKMRAPGYRVPGRWRSGRAVDEVQGLAVGEFLVGVAVAGGGDHDAEGGSLVLHGG